MAAWIVGGQMNCVVEDVIGASAKQDSGRVKERGIDEIDVSAAKGERGKFTQEVRYFIFTSDNQKLYLF
jgi:hypothetical protein